MEAAETWWAWTAAMSVQVALLVAFVAVLDRLLRPWAWPQLRAALWALVLVKLVVPPTLASPVSVASLGLDIGFRVGSGVGFATTQPAALPLIAFATWLAGLVLCAGFSIIRYRRLRREWLGGGTQTVPTELAELIERMARRLSMARPPRVLVKPGASGPAVLGFVRPVVVLPGDWVRTASREQLEHVLLHELAHVARRDPLRSLVCLVLQLAYWFHPLVWYTRARLSFLREICCDETVARTLGGSTSTYRRSLLEMAQPLLQRSAWGQLGFIHGPSQLLARLSWLKRPRPRGPWPRRLVTTGLCGLLLCCVPMARTFSMPPLQDLQGCLQLRYAVYGMLGQTTDDGS
jgi:beta-lactamase regulating signal transducer with metallopeptidase domain